MTGYFTADLTGATYVPLTPTRLLDTRGGTGGLSGAFTNHVARTFGLTGQGGVPANATTVTGNLTVTQQTSLGYRTDARDNGAPGATRALNVAFCHRPKP